ncbi:WhiB family transcriptional regulator [Mycolicibacterium pulveris]|nr:WhiB family transcriptional regulator [Mycolicibacterium pulveris]MCV6980280.1 WhiB family transcriptional regulator [Mycolicibacterium pulveris]
MAARSHVCTAQDLQWQLRARCRGMPTEIFFVGDGERGKRKTAREEYAKRICRACLVRRDCLRYAVAAEEPHGVWGATTPTERDRFTRTVEARHPL